MLHEVLLIALKDLRVEWRSKVTLGQVAPMGLLVLVVFAFAFDANTRLLKLGAGGLFWVAVLFGGTLLIQRAFEVETDDGNFDAFRMSTIRVQHKSDRGATMTKEFCPSWGSQMFASGSYSPDRRGIRVGVIDDASWFKPDAYVYASKKLPHTPVDPEITAYEKMRTT